MKNRIIFMTAACIALFALPAFADTSFTNPISTSNPTQLIASVIKHVLEYLGVIALLLFVYGGFLMLISSGNQERVKTGKAVVTWAIVGLMIIFSSYGMADLLFKKFGGESSAQSTEATTTETASETPLPTPVP
ncbi:MAG TPA: hypothetical protein VJB65_04295 [Patescibacteria group bacterium]|nr:hypothetical protein [Patescibacteria group bacterium]